MICPNCGFDNPAHHKFCTKCGIKLSKILSITFFQDWILESETGDQVPGRHRRYGPLRRDRRGARQVTRELNRHLSQIERTIALASMAIDNLGDLHRYATSEAVDTVTMAEDLLASASQSGWLTMAKQEEFQHLTKAYYVAVHRVTEKASQEIINRFRHLRQSAIEIDQISGWYLKRVRELLRRQ